MLEHPSTTVVPADAPGVPEASVHSAASSDFDRRHEALLGDILAARERRVRARRKRIQDRRRAFGDLCEASEGLAVAWLRRGTSIREIVAYADGDVWLLRTLARWLRLGATRRIDRLRHASRRSAYYEREKARRQRLAAERRAAKRRTTTNPCPTKEQLLEAWERVRESNEDLLRFGSLMEDLACYVDSSLVRAESGEIVARRGGVKAWLQTNIPALYLKYKTVMAYKAAARKLKQMTGLRDPVPAARLVETPAVDDAVEVVRAREVYAEVMRETPRNRTAYLDRIDALVNPERVAEATRRAGKGAREDDKITVRTKSDGLGRLE